jgi:hypothetical protein
MGGKWGGDNEGKMRGKWGRNKGGNEGENEGKMRGNWGVSKNLKKSQGKLRKIQKIQGEMGDFQKN